VTETSHSSSTSTVEETARLEVHLPTQVDSSSNQEMHIDSSQPSPSGKAVDTSHTRHASLNNPHGDQVDENNTSLMDSIFSPGLRSYVTQKFHSLTSSLGVRSSQDLEKDINLSQSSHITHVQRESTSSVHVPHSRQSTVNNLSTAAVAPAGVVASSSSSQSTLESSSKIRLPTPNGVHHAAYRKKPHHNLSPSKDGSAAHSRSDSPVSEHSTTGTARLNLTKGDQSSAVVAGEEEENVSSTPLLAPEFDSVNGGGVVTHHQHVFENVVHDRSQVDVVVDDDGGDVMEEKGFEEETLLLPIEEAEEEEMEEFVEEIEVEVVEEIEEEEEEAVDEVSEEEFDSYLFMANVPPLATLSALVVPPGLPLKPRHAPKVTLVLDLDETLVHCSLEKIDNPDLIFAVPFEGEEYQVYVRKRPGFEEFLSRVSEMFEVAVFTASQKAYADKLLSILDPTRKWIHHRLFRESCVFVLGNYLKDLNVLGRELSKVIIVDNSPHVFAYQVDNGVPIESWYNDSRDRELLHLLPFLETLAACHDVRPLIRDKFQLHKKVEESLRAYHDVTRLARSKHLIMDEAEAEGMQSATERSTSIIEGDSDDDADERTTPAKPSRRKSRVRSRISIAQYDTDSDADASHNQSKRTIHRR
jgi:CTD small phosphatase-like protein 2